MNRSSLLAFLAVTAAPLASTPGTAVASPKKPATQKATAKKTAAKKAPAASSRYLSLAELKKLQRARKAEPLPVLTPLLDGKSLKGRDMKDLATNPPIVVAHAKVAESEAGLAADPGASGMNGERLAQAFPPSVAPAPIRRTPARPVTPKWVRYPLEFQLAGIGLGTKAVDKDRFNRIDRYGLFALHGNPTAVVVPTSGGTVTVNQQPPEVASLFPGDPGGGLPDWAAAITVQLDNNHVEWLYRRDTYSMGFVVDRLGFVDAIVVAGVYSPIARTQLEDPVHTIKLSDDLRKVLFRYGYPDTIETYQINAAAGVNVGGAGGGAAAQGGEAEAGAAPGGAPGAGGPEQPGAGAGEAGAGTTGGASNTAFRTFEVRYEQSYNVVFTIRNNRVVRIYIFGDPDFFNEQRRQALRTGY
jgi:hypothetical protein